MTVKTAVLCAGYRNPQSLYLYNISEDMRVPLGVYELPPGHRGEIRCDLHPRFSPDGSKIVFDSAHDRGRQVCLVDVGEVVR